MKIFKTPFAATGDRIAIPEVEQPSGEVSQPTGWTPDYQLPNTDPNYKPVGRDEMNGVLYEITEALGQIQQFGFADWQNIVGGWPIGANVRHDGGYWQSLANSNTEEPGTGALWKELLFGNLVPASETTRGVIEIATAAEAIALTDDQRALTSKKLDDALMGGNARAETPSQFNNSTKIATTEFVKRQGLQSSAFTSINSATTLTAAHAGASIFVGGNTNYTVTLPLAETLPPGARIEFFFSSTSGTQTIQRQGSNIIYLGGGGTYTSVSGSTGDTVTFVTNGVNWYAVSGTLQMGHAASFGKFFNPNGYQKLPGGLILQWGRGSSGSGVTGTFTDLPIAFPNGFLLGVPVDFGFNTSAAVPGAWDAQRSTLSKIYIVWSTTPADFAFLALGY